MVAMPAMIETRERDRLGAEALQHIRVGQIGIEDLDRDFAVERLIDRLVDGSHTAATQLVDDAVLSDGGPDHCWKSWKGPKFVSVGGPIPACQTSPLRNKRDPCRTRDYESVSRANVWMGLNLERDRRGRSRRIGGVTTAWQREKVATPAARKVCLAGGLERGGNGALLRSPYLDTTSAAARYR